MSTDAANQSHTIESIQFLPILNSGGSDALEVTVRLADGSAGVASAPSAIKRGKREATPSRLAALNPDDVARGLTQRLCRTAFESQAALDGRLVTLNQELSLGSNVTLGLSLAVWSQ